MVSHSLNFEIVEEIEETDNDLELNTPYHSKMNIFGEIEILLHPLYQVPCPYLRIWNENGTDSTFEVPDFLNKWKNQIGLKFPSPSNHNNYSWVLEPEEHPWESGVWMTIHVCDILRLTQSVHQIATSDPFQSTQTLITQEIMEQNFPSEEAEGKNGIHMEKGELVEGVEGKGVGEGGVEGEEKGEREGVDKEMKSTALICILRMISLIAPFIGLKMQPEGYLRVEGMFKAED